MNALKEKLIEKIKEGEVVMVPRWHFVLRTALIALGVVIVALIAVYLFSFILYALHKSGVLFAPLFGWHGIMLFVVASPWLLILIVGLFLLTLYLLVSRYAFSYKKPLVYSMLGIVLFVIAAASLIHQSMLHEHMGQFLERRPVPGLAPLYKDAGERRPEGVLMGTIIAVTSDTLTLETNRGEITVLIDERTKMPRGNAIREGAEVTVIGMPSEDGLRALGIRPLGERGKQFHLR